MKTYFVRVDDNEGKGHVYAVHSRTSNKAIIKKIAERMFTNDKYAETNEIVGSVIL